MEPFCCRNPVLAAGGDRQPAPLRKADVGSTEGQEGPDLARFRRPPRKELHGTCPSRDGARDPGASVRSPRHPSPSVGFLWLLVQARLRPALGNPPVERGVGRVGVAEHRVRFAAFETLLRPQAAQAAKVKCCRPAASATDAGPSVLEAKSETRCWGSWSLARPLPAADGPLPNVRGQVLPTPSLTVSPKLR